MIGIICRDNLFIGDPAKKPLDAFRALARKTYWQDQRWKIY
jgi:hypothetical protein